MRNSSKTDSKFYQRCPKTRAHTAITKKSKTLQSRWKSCQHTQEHQKLKMLTLKIKRISALIRANRWRGVFLNKDLEPILSWTVRASRCILYHAAGKETAGSMLKLTLRSKLFSQTRIASTLLDSLRNKDAKLTLSLWEPNQKISGPPHTKASFKGKNKPWQF